MTQSTQGIVIALLISLLIGVIIGFYLRQSRINDLSNALKQQKKRIEEVEQEHEKRLQEATLQLQSDYEQQLAEKIELYQSQYDDQVSQLESEYDARLSLMGPAMAGAGPDALGSAVVGAGASADAVAIEQRIRKQYETRLKEAAHKIQQAYEQHLKLKLNESREALQQDYENRLAEKIEHYQDQLDTQLAQVATPQPLALGMVAPVPGPVAMATGPASPMARATLEQDALEAEIRQEYELKLAEKIEHYQDDMAKRLEELEQEYEARLRMVQSAPSAAAAAVEPVPSDEQIAALENKLRSQLEERFKNEYDQRLAEAIERYQDEMVQRTQALEREYEARLQLVQQQMPASPMPSEPVAAGESEPDLQVEPITAPEAPLPDRDEVDLSRETTIDSFQVEESLFSDGPLGDEPDWGFEPPTPTAPESTPQSNNEVSPEIGFGDIPAPQPAQPPVDDALDLDDLLTQERGESLVSDQTPMDDGGFDLENLEDLLKEQENDDDDNNLFENLDDLSNLS